MPAPERGDYETDPPLRALVNVSIVLTGSPTVLLAPYLHWQALHARAAGRPAPSSIAPGIPPQPPADPGRVPVDALTAEQRELLRQIVRMAEEIAPDLPRVERISATAARLFHDRVEGSSGRRRAYEKLTFDPRQLDVLLRAGLLDAARLRRSGTPRRTSAAAERLHCRLFTRGLAFRPRANIRSHRQDRLLEIDQSTITTSATRRTRS